MKKVFILTILTFTFLSVINLKAQINLDSFLSNIIEKSKTLEKKRASDIKKFMKYGYKKNSELENDSICKIPIYTIFTHHKFMNEDRSNDSLFVYMNPKSLNIGINFYHRKCC